MYKYYCTCLYTSTVYDIRPLYNDFLINNKTRIWWVAY